MPSDSRLIGAFIERLQTVTKQHSMGTINVMPAEPSARAAYEVDLEPSEFLDALELLNPKVVYVETNQFQAKWQIGAFHNWSDGEEDENDQGHNVTDDEDGNLVSNPTEEQIDGIIARFPAIKAEVGKWSHYDGRTYIVAALFFADGIYHTMSLTEDWMHEFYLSCTQLKATHVAAAGAVGHVTRNRRRAAFLEQAERLAKDPMFDAPKATREKREYLASKLFPDLAPVDWADLVTEAANMVWYGSGNSISKSR